MKKIMISALLVSLTLLITCCAKGSSSDNNSKVGVETVSLSSLSQESDKYNAALHSLSLDNISIPDELTVSFPKDTGIYKVKVTGDFNDKSDSIYSSLIPEEIFNSGEVTLDESITPYGPTFYDEKSGMRLDIGENGFVSFTLGRITETEETENDRKLIKEDTAASKAAAEFEDRLDKAAHYDSGVKPFLSLEYPNGDTQIVLQPTFNDIPIESIGNEYPDREDLGKAFENVFAMKYNWCKVNASGEVSEFIRQCAFNEYETEEKYESIITPECAARLVSEKLSASMSLEIKGMGIVYLPFYVENKSVQKRITDQVDSGAKNIYWADNIIRLVPYWEIYFDLTENAEQYALVDAKTGEVFYINNAE